MTAIYNRKPADTSALARPPRLRETIAELILECREPSWRENMELRSKKAV